MIDSVIFAALISSVLALCLGVTSVAWLWRLARGQNHQHPEVSELKATLLGLQMEVTGLTDDLAKALTLVRKLRARQATRDHRERKQSEEPNGSLDDDDAWVKQTNLSLALGRRTP